MTEKATLPASAKRILIADGDNSVRGVLTNFLSRHYAVESVATSDDAMELIRHNYENYGLVLADLQLKPANGYNLAAGAQMAFPDLKIALMTRTKIEPHFSALRKNRLYHVITKSVPFHYDDFLVSVQNLLEPSRALGLERYLREPVKIREESLRTREDRASISEDAVSFFRRFRQYDTDVSVLQLAVDEVINNALYHAYRRPNGTEKYAPSTFRSLDDNESLKVQFGRDNTWLGCSITDNCGTLTPETIMKKIERQISQEGLMDESGRGLYLARTLADRMIINIEPGKLSQVIMLFRHRSANEPKPLHINVISKSIESKA